MTDPTVAPQPQPQPFPTVPPPQPGPSPVELELVAEVQKLRELLARAEAARSTVDVDDDAPIELPDVHGGDWVRVWYVDSQMGPETIVEAFGQVLRVVELPSGPAVVVAWAAGGGVSAPIPLDHRIHGKARVDAPRVELVET